MTTIRVFGVSLVIAVFSLSSCGDDDNPTGSGLVNQLPNQVGMLWVYEVYDSLTQKTDTVQVSITDKVASITPGFIWKTFWKSTQALSIKIADIAGDTLDFVIDTTFIAPPLERFVFPLSLGSQWEISRNAPAYDSSEVTEIVTVKVPAGQFFKCALIERKNYDGFEGGYDSIATWIAPNVGIVSRYFRSIGADGGGGFFVTKNQTWELINYDLSTFSMKQFPGTIGNEWVYEIVDSRLGSPDTVTVSVTNNLNIDGFYSTKMWLIKGNMITDTHFVAYVNNQVWVSEDTIMVALWDWRYEFPLAVGRHWGISTFAPTPIIDSKELIITPAGKFSSAYHYTMSGGGFNSYWSVEDWLVAGVGVVKRTYSIFDFIPFGFTQEWTLLSYKLK